MNSRLTLRQQFKSVARKVPGLVSARYFVSEVCQILQRRPSDAKNELEELFLADRDPWNYEVSPKEQRRLHRELQTIVSGFGTARIPRALEIGCAEGVFSEMLMASCDSLLCVDSSPTALSRARQRCTWPSSVQFAHFDLHHDAIPGTFDLIVIISVLDYIENPLHLMQIRSRLVAALAPGGMMLMGNSINDDVSHKAWWGQLLIRGARWMARYFAQHPKLQLVEECEMEAHLDCLYRKLPRAS